MNTAKPKRQFHFMKNPLIGGLSFTISLTLGVYLWPYLKDSIWSVFFGGAVAGLFGYWWKFAEEANWSWRKYFLIISLNFITIAGFYIYKEIYIIRIRVVGNSHGGLVDDIKRFNKSQRRNRERIRAELIYDWSGLDTSQRWGKAKDYLQGKLKADIIELDGIWMESAIKMVSGGLLPLEDLFDKDQLYSKFILRALQGGMDMDTSTVYGIPLYVDVGMFLYRKDILGEIESPIKFEDFQKLLIDKVKELKGIEGFIFQSAQYEGLNCIFFELLSISGGTVFDDYEKIMLNSEKVRQTIKTIHDAICVTQIIPPSVLVFKEEQSRKLFSTGHAAVLRNWPYVLTVWGDNINVQRENIGIVRIENYKPVLGGWYLSISKWCKHPDKACNLIQFLTSTDQQVKRARYVKKASRRFPSDPEAIKLIKDDFPWISDIEQLIMCSQSRPRMVDYESFSEKLSKMLFTILANPHTTDESIRKALEATQEDIE